MNITSEDVALATAGLKAGNSALPYLQQVKEFLNSDVISASFDGKGERLQGSEKIEVEVHRSEDGETVWWLSVKPVDEYAFVRFPVTPLWHP